MRALRADALANKTENYVDIPYNFVIDNTDGTVYEARGAKRNSGATLNHNDVSHAICVMGNFEIEEPSSLALRALADLLVYGWQQKWWTAPALTGGHRDSGFATACPGSHLEARIKDVNDLARSLAQSPAPAPTRVAPMYDPPYTDIVASLQYKGTGWYLLRKDGAIYTLGDAPKLGHLVRPGHDAAQLKSFAYGSWPFRQQGYIVIWEDGYQARFPSP